MNEQKHLYRLCHFREGDMNLYEMLSYISLPFAFHSILIYPGTRTSMMIQLRLPVFVLMAESNV